MRSLTYLSLLFVAVLLLGGCGSNNSSSNNSTPTQLTDKTVPQIPQPSEEPDDDTSTETPDTDTPVDDTPSTDGFDTDQKAFMYALMLDEYYWYDEVPTNVDTTELSTPEAMLDALKYSELDRWSYIQSPQNYEDYANQASSGFGCLFFYPNAVITEPQIDSPCEAAGVLRGDLLTHLNGEPVTGQNYSEAAADNGVTSIFTVERGGISLDLNITAAPYNYRVVNQQVITLADDTKVGHLLYDSFTRASYNNLDAAFTTFKDANVTELIVDLRYNGGGELLMASYLLDWIEGGHHVTEDDTPQFYLIWNDKQSSKNSFYSFFNEPNSLALERVTFINTEFTASASESVINALTPYVDVINIGTTSHGKPVGFRGKENGDFYYFLVNFAVYNANGEGDYYDGIDAHCYVEDTVLYPRTDVRDPMLAEALHYIENDTCTP